MAPQMQTASSFDGIISGLFSGSAKLQSSQVQPRSRSKSRERQRQEDGHAAGSAETATPGVEEEKALAQQLRDIGFDD